MFIDLEREPFQFLNFSALEGQFLIKKINVQLYRRGLKKYLSSGWNWVDLGMDTLFLYSYISTFVVYHLNMKDKTLQSVMYDVADGAFALATILRWAGSLFIIVQSEAGQLLRSCLIFGQKIRLKAKRPSCL